MNEQPPLDEQVDYWEIPNNIDITDFDLTWRPNMFEEPWIHQFPSQHQPDGGPRLVVYGATQVKYETEQVGKAYANDMSIWEIPPNINCDDFDFSWHPPRTERPYIYQFGTQHQKTGGPRYIQKGARRIRYIDTQKAVAIVNMEKWRIDRDVIVNSFDFSWHPDATDLMYNYSFNDSAIIYSQGPGLQIKHMTDIVADITIKPLDIIFLSNGETGEQERYDRLCQVAGREVRWVRGIDGRENAIRHAAEISNTNWFILFPAKIWASDTFDYNFQPNRSYEPKHYIFYSTNPLNGLEYGHQAAVCYNRNLVLETTEYGLDFTMSKLHDIVPISCGIAQYNSDITMTWRTAFREVIKLRADGSEESLERLRVWLTYARGQHAEWSIIGAQDGINYYDKVGGDHEQLMKTFKWSWLKFYFNEQYREQFEKMPELEDTLPYQEPILSEESNNIPLLPHN
jgi:hypothetical protein